MYGNEVKTILNYIKSKHPLFFIQNSDFFAVRDIIEGLRKDSMLSGFDYWTYSESYGAREECHGDSENLLDYGESEDESDDSTDGEFTTENKPNQEGFLTNFLKTRFENGILRPQLIVLRDISRTFENGGPEFSDVISYIRDIAEKSITDENYATIVFIVESRSVQYPKELENLITVVDINPLDDNDIKQVVKDYILGNKFTCTFLENDDKFSEFSYALKGLHKYQIEQILTIAAVDGNGTISKEQSSLILDEKKQLIKKSGILEIINRPVDFGKIGGLGKLKEWLQNKEFIYRDVLSAQKFGVSIPKGILIVGMPGCGKSLTAKAVASLFKVPLVRLDVGSLLGQYVGESDANMKKALSLSESFSPCVLWIDELEKAFSGIEGNSGDSDIVKRLFGQFLTWMQEKDNTVFIVATANSISNLPPEFLRRGRFDEIFFVDLPNEKERKEIFKLKIESKEKSTEEIDLQKLAKETEGYSGSDIESIVNNAIEKLYIKICRNESTSKQLTTDDILSVKKETKSISVTLEKKIKELREKIKDFDLKSAS